MLMTAERPIPREYVEKRSLTLWSMLVWAYREQRVGNLGSSGGYATDIANSRGARQWFELLVSFAAPTDDTPRPAYHPDAILLHAAVLEANGYILIEHARLGERPERCWQEPEIIRPPVDRRRDEHYGRAEIDGRLQDVLHAVAERYVELIPVYERRGRKMVHVRDETGKRLSLYCPVHYWPDPAYVEFTHEIADAFDAAMARLRGIVADLPFRAHDVIDIPDG